MSDKVFLYGTLRPFHRGHQIIAPFVWEITPAKIRGVLYHTGYGFPVVDVEADGLVLGELVTLKDPAVAFGVLDRYEGISDASFSLYRRVEVEAFPSESANLMTIPAQVYAANPAKLSSIPGLERVPDGDWLKFSKNRHMP